MKATVYVAAGFALATTGLASGQDFVIDQIGADDGGSLGTALRAAQYFEPAFSVYDIAALDDFTIGAGLTITSIEAVIAGFNGYVDTSFITSYQVNIYSSPDMAGLSLVGDVFSLDFATPTSQFDYAVVIGDGATTNAQFDVEMRLAAGTYWVAVIPTNVFGENGQTAIATSSLQEGFAGAFQANPNGGFGFGPLQAVDANLAYRIEAFVPAPGGLAVLALGLIGCRRRRR